MAAAIDVVRRMTDEVFIKGNLDLIDELVSDDFTTDDVPPGMSGDKAGYKMLAEMVAGAFTNRRVDFDEYMETTDGRIVENWAMLGTHSGEAFGMPASNQEVRIRGVEIFKVEDGKIVRQWGAVDLSDVAEKVMAAG